MQILAAFFGSLAFPFQFSDRIGSIDVPEGRHVLLVLLVGVDMGAYTPVCVVVGFVHQWDF